MVLHVSFQKLQMLPVNIKTTYYKRMQEHEEEKNETSIYLNSQIIPSMFPTTYDSKGRDRKSQIAFSEKISNVFVQWNLEIIFFVRSLRKGHKISIQLCSHE